MTVQPQGSPLSAVGRVWLKARSTPPPARSGFQTTSVPGYRYRHSTEGDQSGGYASGDSRLERMSDSMPPRIAEVLKVKGGCDVLLAPVGCNVPIDRPLYRIAKAMTAAVSMRFMDRSPSMTAVTLAHINIPSS